METIVLKEQRVGLRPSQRIFVPSVFFFALLLRLFYVWKGQALGSLIWSDMKGYVDIARDVLAGEWLDTHFFQSIGFPLLLAGLMKLTPDWKIVLPLLQALISTLTLLPIYDLSRKSFGERTAQVILIFMSLHLPWILFTGFALPETIFTFLLSLCAWLTWKVLRSPSLRWTFLWALSFILAFWLKGTHVFWAPLFFCALLRAKKWVALFVVGGVLGMGLLGHGVLSYSTIGNFQLSASTGGLNLVEGKCPEKKNRDSAGWSWNSPLYYQLYLKQEKKWDKPFTNSSYFMGQGLECIKRDPMVLLQSFEAIPFLFMGNTMWPLNQLHIGPKVRLFELFYTIFLLPGLAFFAFWLWRRRDLSNFIIWCLPVIALFICVYIFKSEARYRLPFDLWLIPMAVKGWSLLKITSFEERPASGVDSLT